MNNRKGYWEGREIQKLNEQLKDVNKLEKFIKEQYKIAFEEIESRIIKLFIKYSSDNNLSYMDAMKLLSASEYTEWKRSLKEYIKLIELTGDEELLLELNTLAMKSRISRLEEFHFQIDKQLNALYETSHKEIGTLLSGSVKDSYYKSIFNVQKFFGIGKPFATLNKTAINEVLTYPWSGANYSTRIWGNRAKSKKVISQHITQMIIQGKGSKEVAKSIAIKMQVDYKNAIRLINTEHAFVMGEASARGYKETGVEEYEILSTLDIRTSDICRQKDGKVYKLSDKKIGVNYPPFHVRCRTTTVPYFAEDEEEEFERAARIKEGKTYDVPANMKYEEWYKKNVKK